MARLLRPWSVLLARAPPITTDPTAEPGDEAPVSGGVREAGGEPEPPIRRLDGGRIGELATR